MSDKLRTKPFAKTFLKDETCLVLFCRHSVSGLSMFSKQILSESGSRKVKARLDPTQPLSRTYFRSICRNCDVRHWCPLITHYFASSVFRLRRASRQQRDLLPLPASSAGQIELASNTQCQRRHRAASGLPRRML